MFTMLDEKEIYSIDGGGFLAFLVALGPVGAGICVFLGGYAVVREMVRDQGRADAYADGYGR